MYKIGITCNLVGKNSSGQNPTEHVVHLVALPVIKVDCIQITGITL